MVDLLIATVLTGLAVTYVLELLNLTILGAWLGKSNINIFFAPQLSFGALYVFYGIDINLVVTVPAATFISLALTKYLNKPAVVQSRIPRL
jgi:predicted membrane-bound dolichyl-phosphate-mannose-protein mannosyltransferase